MKRIAIFLSGRGSNMQALVERLPAAGLSVALVFSDRPDAPGLRRAAEQGLPVASLPKEGARRADYDARVLALMQVYRIDHIVLAGYMRLLSPVLVRAFPKRIVNIHPADTGAHQGLGGYEWAWNLRLPETRITVHYVDEGLDTGEVIARAPVDLRGAESLSEVEARGLAVEHELYPRVLCELWGAG